MPQESTDELPWVEYVERLLRWRRFVALGVLGSWAAILAWALLWPRNFGGEATLSFPPVIPRVKQEEPQRVGMPLALYKKFTKLLGSQQILQEGLKGVLEPPEIRALEANFGQHISALTTSPLTDIRRITAEDTIIGIQINYSTRPEERAKQVVAALARLSKNTFVNLLLVEQIEAQTALANSWREVALAERARLTFTAESLEKQAADVRRLVQEFPNIGPSSPAQVVETRGEGSHFLAPPMQMIGVRAHQAENASMLRVLDKQLAFSALRLEFLRKLDQRVYAEGIQHDSRLDGDVANLIQEELRSFNSTRATEPGTAALLKAEVDALSARLASATATTRFVQAPTARREGRASMILALAALAVVVVLAAALLGESWNSFHRRVAGRPPVDG